MTATDSGVVRYTCTRIQLIDALAALPLGGYLTLEARGRFADCILGQLPEASAEQSQRAFDAGAALATQAERERIAQLAEEHRAGHPVTFTGEDGCLSIAQRPFADLIREQP